MQLNQALQTAAGDQAAGRLFIARARRVTGGPPRASSSCL